ncbi:MAG: hypothetical protein DCF25_15345 [Leptolyngbya foveolarum]|uniref:Uncharacterized protein n=1 Tax=Leptolyngbya foveolarum TaxID=47253 RepID=A0A2W4TZ52_9CYAN|nr:MAG: hypothetical protein DCF25_15345 [Leptolyngbya foveolarum]
MSHHTLFEIAFADEYRLGVGSIALLALRRFCRRLLKQVGQVSVGLLSLFLIVSIATHSAAPPEATPTETTSMSMPHRLSNQPVNPSSDPAFSPNRRLSDQPSTALPAKGKPFQVLRPKMTYHRLTTSRFSIPLNNSQAVADRSESE